MKQRRGPEKDLIHRYSTTTYVWTLNKGCRLRKPVCALCPWVSFLVALPISAWQLLYWLIYLGGSVCGSVFPLPLPARIVKTEGSQARSATAEPPSERVNCSVSSFWDSWSLVVAELKNCRDTVNWLDACELDTKAAPASPGPPAGSMQIYLQTGQTGLLCSPTPLPPPTLSLC